MLSWSGIIVQGIAFESGGLFFFLEWQKPKVIRNKMDTVTTVWIQNYLTSIIGVIVDVD